MACHIPNNTHEDENFLAQAMNGLNVNDEEMAVELFASNIMQAGSVFLEKPMETPFIPSWNRVVSAVPDIFERLAAAVEADHKAFSS